jgi:nucleotide-binding universal stress UspA family protein
VNGSRERLGNILVATDFSEHARIALERVARLPLALGAIIQLVHVTEDGDRSSAWRALEEARATLARAFAAMDRKPEIVISVQQGHPDHEIARAAHAGRAELIVMGRHGQRTLRERLLGTTAERVTREGDVSVLVVGKPPEGPYRRPVVAVDMSDSSRLALELVVRMMVRDAIDVLHVVPATLDAELPLAEHDRLVAERRARRELHELLETFAAPAKWQVIVRSGDPREVILEEARSHELIALGTKGRRRLAHAIAGSVAETAVRAADCDVLVARLPRVA